MFNENTRVKISTILHLMRLGYQYLSLKEQLWDIDTDIFPSIFTAALTKINPSLNQADSQRLLEDVKLELDNEDFVRAFFDRLSSQSNIKLVDFDCIITSYNKMIFARRFENQHLEQLRD